MDTEPLNRLSRDLRKAATTLSADEARFLVDAYYQMQDNRIRSAAQVRQLTESGEPHDVLRWLEGNAETLENSIKSALDKYSASHTVGAWARSIVGVGPVICAGLLAHIDITKAPTAGHIWNYAGLNPSVSWEKGQKRPWNAALKTLCWKLGESFVKVSGNENAFYGAVYRERKACEIERNLRGELSAQAAEVMKRKKIGNDTDAYVWYAGCLTLETAKAAIEGEKAAGAVKKMAGEPGSGVPMLPPAHIHARAKRSAVKLFLSHLHQVWYEIEHGHPPVQPYALAHMAHAHFIAPPNWRTGQVG